jgi:hypothetical protein
MTRRTDIGVGTRLGPLDPWGRPVKPVAAGAAPRSESGQGSVLPADEFSADPAPIDADRVHPWLSEHAYWARGRSRDLQDRAVAGSRTFGVYDAHALYTKVGFVPLVEPGNWMERPGFAIGALAAG